MVSLVLGQEDINHNGFNKFYYPNGSLQSEGNLKDGKPEGYWVNYYPTGIIKSEGNRKNHELDSIWVFYTITGDTISKISYFNGKKNGFSYEYFTKASNPTYIGNIKSKELYINNLKEGASEYFYENGSLREIREYINNKEDGRGFVFANDGRIIMLYKYRKGAISERERLNRFNNENLKTGVWKEFFEYDKVKIEAYYKNGLLDGYYKEYSEKGKLLFTHLYRNGNLIERIEDEEIESKEVVEYYADGSVKSKGSFVDKKPIGIHKEYDREEGVIISRIYDDFGHLLSSGKVDTNGFKVGMWEEYDPDGNVKAKGRYRNNRKQGKWVYYFGSGAKEQEGEFERGRLSGLWKWYYPTGELWKEEEFYNNREEGIYIEYDVFGNIIVEGEYFDGEQEGAWLTLINDHKATGKYVTGLMDGRWKHFYDNGNLAYEGHYIQGNADGKHKYFYPNGNLKEEQFFNMGIRQKHWKKYDEEGQLIITISYKDDQEYRINGVKIDFDADVPRVIE